MKAEDLKNSILQLAIQGKLVPQDPTDEPAEILLEKIRQEKEQLIKDKKIKRNNKESTIYKENGHYYEKIGKKGESKCIDEEIPFEIPETWMWCRLSSIISFSLGKTPKRSETSYWEEGTIPWVSIADLNNQGYIDSTKEMVNNHALDTVFKGKIVSKGTLLMSFKLTIGKISILNVDATHNEAIISINPFIDQNNKLRNYLFYVLPNIAKNGTVKSAIKGKTLNSKSLSKLMIPLPPLNEQQRIVEKIEEILPHIEQYDKYEQQLTTLNNEFPEQIKKSILQEAIQGKLVPQDPNDEPAEILLEKIRQEKEQLIKDKKIKRDKNETRIYKEDGHWFEIDKNNEVKCIDEEIPFEIPDTWTFCRLDNILYMITDGAHKTPKYVNKGVPFLSVKDISSGYLDFSDTKFVTLETHNLLSQRCNPQKGDILLTKVGTTGIPVIIDTTKEFSLFVSVALLKFNQEIILNKYLLYLIQSPLVQKQCTENTRGVGNKNWVLRDIKKTLIVLPSIKDQINIVKKLDEILPYIKTV